MTFASVAAVLLVAGASMVCAQAVQAQKANAPYPPHAVPRLQGVTIPGLPAVTSRICVDQFGYLPAMQKVAVISDPQKGYNEADSYTPGKELEVRKRGDGQVVYKGAPTAWRDGAIHEDSGDRGWWFDFSGVKEIGEYYVFDPSTQMRSPVFKVGPDVYYPVLRAAVRMFYYQRQNMPLEAKYTEGPWADAAALTQDKQARAVWAKEDASTARDLAGGWMDAGDTNKYPTFLGEVIHPLLYAYRANKAAFTDSFNIPESGNGLPDLLDEVKYELEWLKKMQEEDGGVYIKMGNIDFSGKWPLAADTRTRFYGAKSSASTLWTAGVFAHAVRVYGEFPQWKAFADELKVRALKAWDWYGSHPREYKPDSGEIKSGLANRSAEEHDHMEANVAVHLFALTGDEKFHQVIRDKAKTSRQLSEGSWSPYEAGAGEALLDYATMASADRALVDQIRQQMAKSAASRDWAPPADADLYRAWMVNGSYHWGSSTPRACYGYTAFQAAAHGGVSAEEQDRLRGRAADMLHSFHGVNPLSAVYLTNMKSAGAELSMAKIFHERWGVSAKIDAPPPGYIVGGANQSFAGKSKNNDNQVEWIGKQPRAKAYADFDLGWPEASWEISEPAIYYQASYIRLLSAFVVPPAR